MKEYVDDLINDLEDKVDDLENRKNELKERFSTNIIDRDIDIIESKQAVIQDIKDYLLRKYFNKGK